MQLELDFKKWLIPEIVVIKQFLNVWWNIPATDMIIQYHSSFYLHFVTFKLFSLFKSWSKWIHWNNCADIYNTEQIQIMWFLLEWTNVWYFDNFDLLIIITEVLKICYVSRGIIFCLTKISFRISTSNLI